MCLKTILITAYSIFGVIHSYRPDYINYNVLGWTREVTLKTKCNETNCKIQGHVVQLHNLKLDKVEVYLGIPYAAPPIGEFRFMPPKSDISWSGIKYADTFGPVCPQRFPDESRMSSERRKEVANLKKFLEKQSEDCLYLNIYTPYQGPSNTRKKSPPYPVMVYIHGESFEWNAGNPYDGSVLASYGNVIVVTLNFRLGILGFLKLEAEETTRQSNFGLMDQLAALVWIKDNIEAFGGDPDSITLIGHGTGAVCASLFITSPLAMMENKKLFHRAVLMSGTALADWALVKKPIDISFQVAANLGCQLNDNFAACLRRKSLDEILAASPEPEAYKATFGPVVDNLFVPSDPKKSMAQNTDIFTRFELIYGITESESKNLPIGGDVMLTHGMLEKERDEELRKYISTRCENNPEPCFVNTRAKYDSNIRKYQDQEYRDYGISGGEHDRATLARDELLDILSDARTVAPVIQTGLHHSSRNIQSYFYVFTHKTHHKEYTIKKTHNGEELPYVFGLPIDGSSSQYTKQEKMFSQILMTYFCNFAYTGNPNMPRENFPIEDYNTWIPYDVEWHEFKPEDQLYLEFGDPIQIGQFYRREYIEYWNNEFPNITQFVPNSYKENPLKGPNLARNHLPWNKYIDLAKFENFQKPVQPLTKEDLERIERIGKIRTSGNRKETEKESFGTLQYKEIDATNPEEVTEITPAASGLSMLIIVGGVFLLANIAFFTFVYVRCIKMKKVPTDEATIEPNTDNDVDETRNNSSLFSSCNIVKIWSKSKVDDGSYEAVNVENKISPKLTRHMSNSTIDAHAKVRDWITNEIIYKYSPQNLRKCNNTKENKNSRKITRQTPIDLPVETDKHSTLGKSPTRPVSPDDFENIIRPIMIKTASIDSSKRRKLANRVSVAVDATPAGRGPSVLMQQPIELTKSLDYPRLSPTNLRRSFTMEDFSPRKVDHIDSELRKSITNIDLKSLDNEPKIITILHKHSKSDPVRDLNYSTVKKMTTFDPNCEVNVTSRDENYDVLPPLSAEESLQNIKRRNFPKVLPDHPSWNEMRAKRLSMPVQRAVYPIFENCQYPNSEPYSPTSKSIMRFPPIPPPRTSTLPRQPTNTQPVCLSEPTLVEENSPSPEPEITCNNLYVGPLVPKNRNLSQDTLNMPKPNKTDEKCNKSIPRAIVTKNLSNPMRKGEPKVVVRPTINKQRSEEKIYARHIPRVVVPDNRPDKVATRKPDLLQEEDNKEVSLENSEELRNNKMKKSQIPTLVKSSNPNLNNSSGSSDSTTTSPSDESDTGTVVKRV